ncbi:MAG TPA: rhodanese-like domain-containing protein [Terracidiphilus sp.]|nr:rhodanese-like domain-containing protein [Terracidiphilus sp.]
MNWTAVAVAFGLLILLLFLRQRGRISAAEARERLKGGALVVDVRTEGEFAARHLPGAVNLPLDTIADTLPARVPDKDKTLLLHCQSGMRSGAAQSKLRAMGYTNAFNLGSYARAAQIVAGK